MDLEKQFIALNHVLMCNAVLCIYKTRCPLQISDIMDDNQEWNELKLPKVQSIIRKVSSKYSHGWIRIDVILDNPDEIIERWYIINTPSPAKSSPQANTENKYLIYRKIQVVLRSLFSILNTLPAKAIDLTLSNFPERPRHISLVLTPLSDFPVDEPKVHSSMQISLPEVQTPYGSILIRCEYFNKPEFLIPNLRTPLSASGSFSSQVASPRVVPEKSCDFLSDSCAHLDQLKNDVSTSIEDLQTPLNQIPLNIEELAKMVEDTNFEDKPDDMQALRDRYKLISTDINSILSEWSRSG